MALCEAWGQAMAWLRLVEARARLQSFTGRSHKRMDPVIVSQLHVSLNNSILLIDDLRHKVNRGQ